MPKLPEYLWSTNLLKARCGSQHGVLCKVVAPVDRTSSEVLMLRTIHSSNKDEAFYLTGFRVDRLEVTDPARCLVHYIELTDGSGEAIPMSSDKETMALYGRLVYRLRAMGLPLVHDRDMYT